MALTDTPIQLLSTSHRASRSSYVIAHCMSFVCQRAWRAHRATTHEVGSINTLVTNLFETASYFLFTDYRLMRRVTGLIHTCEIKILLNLPSITLVLIFVNVKTLSMLMLFLIKARGRPWHLRATWCPRAPRWWPLH